MCMRGWEIAGVVLLGLMWLVIVLILEPWRRQ